MILRHGRLLDPASKTDREVDIRIEGDRIAEIAASGSLTLSGAPIWDAKRMWIIPGIVDIHVHLREPGQEYKETIGSGSEAAAAGGVTTLVAMPNTNPVIDNAELVAYVARRGEETGLARVLPMGAVTMGQRGEVLAPYGEMKDAGAVALSDDGHPVKDPRLMRSALEYASDFGLTVHSHAEDLRLSRGGQMHEGRMSTRLGLLGWPAVAEEVAVARDLALAEYTRTRLHVCHVSCAASVRLIRAAKKRGVQVTAEVTPHHLLLNHEVVEGYCTNFKMNPPLREEADRLALIEGLKDGTLDAVATDHAPHSPLEKDTAFDDAAFGVIGLQTALPVVLALWRQDLLPLLTAIERLTCGPAGVLGLPYGRVEVDGPADLAIVNPEAEWQLTPEAIVSKSKNSPFLGRPLFGRVEGTLLAGKVVYRRNSSS